MRCEKRRLEPSDGAQSERTRTGALVRQTREEEGQEVGQLRRLRWQVAIHRLAINRSRNPSARNQSDDCRVGEERRGREEPKQREDSEEWVGIWTLAAHAVERIEREQADLPQRLIVTHQPLPKPLDLG